MGNFICVFNDLINNLFIIPVNIMRIPELEIYWAFIGLVFGAALGSFADVAANRSLEDRKWWGGERSKCDGCGKTLSAIELIPIISYLLQRGRCRTCHSKIPMECLYTEIIGGLAGMYIMSSFYPTPFICIGVFGVLAFSLINSICDWKTQYLYDWVTIGIFASALLVRIGMSINQSSFAPLITGAIAALALAFIFGLICICGGGGSGDILLISSFGMLLGINYAAVLFMGSYVIAMVGIICILLSSKLLKTQNVSDNGKTFGLIDREISFGPAICATGITIFILANKIVLF